MVGKYGDQHKRHDLMTIYNNNELMIKRAIVVACQELAAAERKAFYDSIRNELAIAHTIEYIDNISHPKYYEEEDWKPVDIPDWDTY